MKKHNPLDRLIEQYDFHTMLFEKVIDSVNHEDAKIRINGKTNHMLWLVGNLSSTRYDLAKRLKGAINNEYSEMYENHKGIDENIEYPSLENLLNNWKVITPILREKLQGLSDKELFSEPKFEIPTILDNTLVSYILFLIDRESYVIGQLAFIRKALGYEALQYDIFK